MSRAAFSAVNALPDWAFTPARKSASLFASAVSEPRFSAAHAESRIPTRSFATVAFEDHAFVRFSTDGYVATTLKVADVVAVLPAASVAVTLNVYVPSAPRLHASAA